MITDNLGRPAPERLQLFWILTKQEMIDDEVAVASDGQYANHLHLAPDR